MKSAINITKASKREIKKFLLENFLPEIFIQFPWLENNSLMIIHGSVITGKASKDSDIDVMIFLPAKLMKKHHEKLFKYRIELWKKNEVTIGYNFSLEELGADEMWNNDMLLHIIKEAIPLYDPLNVFKKIKKKYSKFPKHILKQKLRNAAWLTMRNRYALKSHVRKDDLLTSVNLRTKVIQSLMIALHLKYGLLFNEKYLYQNTKQNKRMQKYAKRLDRALQKITEPGCDRIIDGVIKDLNQELNRGKQIPKDSLLKWDRNAVKTKYRITPLM